MPGFKGTKLAHDTSVCVTYRNVHKIEVHDHNLMLFDEPGVIGSGGNSGFQAINIAAQFGATRILLIGFDMHAANGVHWHGRHGGGLINPSDVNFTIWRRRIDAMAGTLRSLGIDVVNASEASALCRFPKMSVEEALIRWGL